MANLEDSVRDLKEKNSELALELQSLKILVAQKDKEKLELTKEINELRLKISRMRSGGAAEARKLDVNLQACSKDALSHLVQASGAMAKTMEIVQQFMQDYSQQLDATSPRWNSNASADKVNKVPPLLLGGQSIQPVVSLSRTMLSNRSINRSPNQSNGITHRALPMHMLQDVYIPLTRIDAADVQANGLELDENMDIENSAEDLGLPDNEDQLENEGEESHQQSTDDMDESRGLDAVLEESGEQYEDERARDSNAQNPLEGPSWLLDVASTSGVDARQGRLSLKLEPDSTTPCDTPAMSQSRVLEEHPAEDDEKENRCMFTPTVRQRKRNISPPSAPRHHGTGKVLKVVVSKMRFPHLQASKTSPPPKMAALSSFNSPRRSSMDGAANVEQPSFHGFTPLEVERSSMDVEPSRSTHSIESGADRSSIDFEASRSALDLETRRLNIWRPSIDVESRRLTDVEARKLEAEMTPPSGKDAINQPSFDAPSPNGATDSAVIVCETAPQTSTPNPRRSRRDSLLFPDESHTRARSDSDSSAGDPSYKSRPNRKQRKEKQLNSELQPERRRTSRSASRHCSACSDSEASAGESNTKSRRSKKRVYKEKAADSESHTRPESRSESRRLEMSDSESNMSEQDSRGRRNRKQVSYKEKPLNRKLRR